MGRGTSSNDEIWKKQMFSLKGEEWKSVRGAVTPIFTPLKLKKMVPLVNKVAADLESRVASLVRRDELLDPMLLGAKFSTDTTASLGCNLVISRHCLQDSVLSFSTVRFSFSSQYQNPRRCHEGSVLR